MRLGKPGTWLSVIVSLVAILAGIAILWPSVQARRLRNDLIARGFTLDYAARPARWFMRPLGSKEFAVVGVGYRAGTAVSLDEMQDLLGRLSYISRLEVLSLPAAPIEDQHLACLEDLPHLRSLDLTGTGIGDEGLPAVAHCRRLQELSLSGTRVSDEGLKSLHGLKKLESLYLDNTEVGDDGVRLLASQCPRLRDLSVSNSNVSSAGLDSLAGVLPELAVTDD